MQSAGHIEAPRAAPEARILFVDDEPMILRSIRRLLTARAPNWEMRFAEGGHAALEALAACPVDVIVSDMHMGEMNGADLLREVQDRYPETVRIVLSGHTDQKLVFRTVPVAHQFVSKPFDPALLKTTLSRACELRTLLDSAPMRRVVGKSNDLPSAPPAYAALTRALSSPDVSLSDVAAAIERDVALSAKILQIVSSAFFGLPSGVKSIRSAVTYLGIDTMKALVLSAEVFRALPVKRTARFELAAFQKASLATAHVARKLLEGRPDADDAFMAGLLHDVGQLIIASRLPDDAQAIERCMSDEGASRCEAEQRVIGGTHGELGAYLLGLWGLPQRVVEAVAHHHAPGSVESETFDVVAAVEVASRLVHEALGGDHRPTQAEIDASDAELHRRGLLENSFAWRRVVRQALSAGESTID